MNRAVIGIGSNIQPKENIPKAISKIAQLYRILRQSRFVETHPVGDKGQPHFLNGAILIETDMEQDELKEHLRKVERELGRIRGVDRNEPRTIDLDIVVWGEKIVDEDVYEREFLREAVREVCPTLKIGDP